MFCLIFFTICSSCRKFCDNWKSLQFFSKHIINVFANGFYIPIEKHSHLLTVKPNGFFFQTHFKLHVFIWLVQYDFAGLLHVNYILISNPSQSGPKGNFCLKRSSFS